MTTLKTFNVNALEEGRKLANERMKERIAQGLPARKTPIERANEQPDSLRRAITAKCYECVGMDDDPDWRRSVRECTSYKCPLYPVRPYQQK